MRPCSKPIDSKGKPRRLGALPPAIATGIPNASVPKLGLLISVPGLDSIMGGVHCSLRHAVFGHAVLGIGQRAAGPVRHNGDHHPQVRRIVGQARRDHCCPYSPRWHVRRAVLQTLTPLFPYLAPCHPTYQDMRNPLESTTLPCAVTSLAIRSIILRNTAEPIRDIRRRHLLYGRPSPHRLRPSDA